MKTNQKFLAAIVLLLCTLSLSSCFRNEDPGPLQQGERHYAVVDFDRLEMGSAFIINVEQGAFFSITARGDIRNLDDLIVHKNGNTLIIRYDNSRGRHHDTYIDIVMPALRSANFGGASNSIVTGFSDQENFDLILSGASVSQVNMESTDIDVVLSGASNLTLIGDGSELYADVSGASQLNSFGFSASEVRVNASGASKARVTAADELTVVASGASVVYYHGNPAVNSNVSGSSSVIKD